MSVGNALRAAWHALFGGVARTFGSLGVLLVLLLAIVPAKDHFREWLHYQRDYQNLIRNRSDAVTLARRFQGGVQQIWLPELGVVDRCTTCHVGLKEASLAGVATQPFRPHPPIPHSLTAFGCTMCHRGQGAATTVEEAHSSTKAWRSRFCRRNTWKPPVASATNARWRGRRNSTRAAPCWHGTVACAATK